ncbi:MAG: hypothetical protein RIQ79_1579 [Verrucomicrobiota bacterium]
MQTRNIPAQNGRTRTELSEGSCKVKIHTVIRSKKGVDYESFVVDYYESGKRVQKNFSTLPEAKSHAKTTLMRLINGVTGANDMRPVEIQESAMARIELEAVGKGLLPVVHEYRRAHEMLAGKGTILEAVQFFLKSGAASLTKKTVPEICKELVQAKTADGLSFRYLRDLRLRCGRFATDFTGQISEITTTNIETWLRGLKSGEERVGPRNRNNYANAVTALFHFAKRAGYLPSSLNTAADELSRAKDVGGKIEIFTPDELNRALERLAKYRPSMLPYFAVGAFSGVRAAELGRLKWENFDFEHNLIEVSADKSKTAQRRLVPIQSNLAAWLVPFRENKGPLCTSQKTQFIIRRWLAKEIKNSDGTVEAGILWHDNGLRHSYGSYRLPILKSAAELALEMGNSPPMIFRHYRELVKPAEAEKYWAIMPPADYAKKMEAALAKVAVSEDKEGAE